MRGSNTTGRFTTGYETESIAEGITNDLQQPVGQHVLWWFYSPDITEVDPVYDVGAYTGGRLWEDPFVLPVVLASIQQGPAYQNERGYYTMDQLTLLVNAEQMYSRIPTMAKTPDIHLRDRIEYRGGVFTPDMVFPKGHIHEHLVVVRIDATEVKQDELVNDPQFSHFVKKPLLALDDDFSSEFLKSRDGEEVVRQRPTPSFTSGIIQRKV